MTKKKKLFLIIICGCVAFGIIMIMILETGSRVVFCPSPLRGLGWLCLEIENKIGAELPQVEERLELIAQLQEKHRQNIPISKEEYRAVFEKIILLIDPELLQGPDFQLNGVACNTIGYTRNDLPGQATLYVRRHELDHIIFNSNEFEANLAGFKEYPIGGVQITWITVWEGLSRIPSNPCQIFIIWNRAKEYFLP